MCMQHMVEASTCKVCVWMQPDDSSMATREGTATFALSLDPETDSGSPNSNPVILASPFSIFFTFESLSDSAPPHHPVAIPSANRTCLL